MNIYTPLNYTQNGGKNSKKYRCKIIKRDFLSRKEYIKILSQPRRISYLSNVLKSYKRPILAPVSSRIHALSLPPKWKILNNWDYYKRILPSYKFDRMIECMFSKDTHVKLPPITCLYKKRVNIKSGNKFNGKLSAKICKRNFKIFETIKSLADFLMIPNNWKFSRYQKQIFEFILSHILEAKLWNYEYKRIKLESTEMEFIRVIMKCTMFVSCILCCINKMSSGDSTLNDCESNVIVTENIHSTPTKDKNKKENNDKNDNNHRKHNNDTKYNNDKKLAQKESKGDEKSKVNGEVTNRQFSHSVKSQKSHLFNASSDRKFEMVPNINQSKSESNILKQIVDIYSLNIEETSVQTTVIETISKFTSTYNIDQCQIFDYDRNDRLLSEIRKFYKKRLDLHNKHVFDDVLLPTITLNEIMKYAELVLANQYMAGKPTRHLQNAFRMKIISWVQEILSIDAWDDCMKCDINLLSYELARYILEEKYPVESTKIEIKNKPEYTDKIILDRPEIKKIKTIGIRGTDLNIKHHLDITPHKPGALCCASLKVWSSWVKDVAENAKLWCVWINQIISNMTHLSAIMRGEVYDEYGNQLHLFVCDWKQFISNLDEDIVAWRIYNTHIQSLTDELTSIFHGKRITCCQCCKEENLHMSDVGIKHLYKQLFDAMETTKNWRHWLQNMVNEAKKLTCISEGRCLCHIPFIEISPVQNIAKMEQNVCNLTNGCPLVQYEQVFVEKDPSIYSIEHYWS